MAYTSHILDRVKTLGFQQATATSISLGLDDLLTIPSKGWLIQDAEQQSLILVKTPSLWECTHGARGNASQSPNHGDLVKLGEAVFDKNNVWVDIKAFVVKYYTRQDKRVLEYQNRSLKREVKYLREIIASKGLSLNSSETPSSDPKETPSSDPNKETLSSDPSQDQSQSSPTL
ncbi:hypothetical protein FXO37_17479 [Capsicum annuum]|nr:hypothetical protein FXO37_17479 [Capsicum annuum]